MVLKLRITTLLCEFMEHISRSAPRSDDEDFRTECSI